MSDVIELRGLRFDAVVGVLAEERTRPQPLEVDVDVVRDLTAAALGDDLAATTDYAAVASLVERVAVEGEFLLMETLAYHVAREVLALDGRVDSVTVAARKLRPPLTGEVASAGVRLTVSR